MLPLVADAGVPRGHRAGAVQRRPAPRSTDIIDADGARATDVRESERARDAMLAIDPLLVGGLQWTPLLIVALKVLVIFVIGLVGTMFMVWFERKIIAGLQNRIGPNKAGPFGLLQTLADGMKLIFKEDFLPDRADRFVFRLAPFLAFVPAFLVWSVIPLGGDFRDGNDGIVTWFGHVTQVQLADPPSASCSCSRCRRSPCTASCSPAGRAARSTRCSARCGRRRRWSATRRRSGSASPPCC